MRMSDWGNPREHEDQLQVTDLDIFMCQLEIVKYSEESKPCVYRSNGFFYRDYVAVVQVFLVES